MTYHESQEGSSFLGSQVNGEEIDEVAATLREPALQQVVPAEVGFLHQGMVDSDKDKVPDLFNTGTLGILVCPIDANHKAVTTKKAHTHHQAQPIASGQMQRIRMTIYAPSLVRQSDRLRLMRGANRRVR